MPFDAFILVISAAGMHTAWNYLIKRSDQKFLLTWGAMILGFFLFSPFLLISPPVPANVWPYIGITTLAEMGYYTTLIYAYRSEDFSLAYPMARGTAPVLTTLWAYLFLHDLPPRLGLIGLFILISGLILMGVVRWIGGSSTPRYGFGGFWAILTCAVFISIYSSVDAAAMRFFSPVPYKIIVSGLVGLIMMPMVIKKYGFGSVATFFRTQIKMILLLSILMFSAYILVLSAFRLTHVGYVAALREISIVIAVIVGWRFLQESMGVLRIISLIFIVIGVVIIGVS